MLMPSVSFAPRFINELTICFKTKGFLRRRVIDAVVKIHCTTDEWTGKLGSAWKVVTTVKLEEGKDLLPSFVLDYIW
jgi:hypothetical protein